MVKKYELKEESDLQALAQQVAGAQKKKRQRAAQQAAADAAAAQPALKQPSLVKGLSFGLGLGILLMGAIILALPSLRQLFTPHKTVPDVVGLTSDEAKKTLANEGMRIIVQIIPAERKTPGTVISVTPPAGTRVAPDGEVTVRVAAKPKNGKSQPSKQKPSIPEPRDPNPPMIVSDPPTSVKKGVAVPDVEGMVISKARAVLEKLGAKVATVAKEDKNQPEGIVLACSCKAGEEIEAGTEVTLTVNTLAAQQAPDQGKLIQIRNYAGFQGQAAINQLWSQGFKVSFAYEASPMQSQGCVIRTIPAAGSMLPPGSEIKVIVAQ